MIPLGDASRRPIHIPIATILIILVNVAVFLRELSEGDSFIRQWSVIPAHIMAGRDWTTILTAMFMHGGWSHIIGNMLFLWVFGPQLEDVMGTVRYLVFYLLGGVAATLAQVVLNSTSTIPNLGASGAIAAVMGAFLVTYPRDQIKTVLFLGWFARITFVPASILIGFWFVMQLFDFGVVARVQTGGVAYLAHIGGAIFGALFARVFEDSRRLAKQERRMHRYWG